MHIQVISQDLVVSLEPDAFKSLTRYTYYAVTPCDTRRAREFVTETSNVNFKPFMIVTKMHISFLNNKNR